MLKRNLLYFLFIALILCLFPVVALTQIDRSKESYSQKVMKSSPDQFELQNASPLFTGSINSISPEGKTFVQEHTVLAQQTITDIDELTTALLKTRELNKQFMDGIGNQLSIWKRFSDINPALKAVTGREIEVFNLATDYQLQENAKWAIIDSVLQQIKDLNSKEQKPANESFTRSALYTDLITYELDLVEFYKNKYKSLLAQATISHSTQENPNLKLPQNVLDQVKPLHAAELNLAKSMIFDLDKNIDNINVIEAKAKELSGFFNEMDKYSLTEVNKIIQNLQLQAESLRTNQRNMLASADMLPVIDGYINYYQNVKTQLEDRIVAYEMTQATYIAAYDTNITEIALSQDIIADYSYGGISDWASSAWNGLKGVNNFVVGGTFAAADYITGKTFEQLFTAKDYASTIYERGWLKDMNSQNLKEMATWITAYDDASRKSYDVSIKDTLWDPLKATWYGDSKKSLGQSAVNKVQDSFKSVDDYAAVKTGTNFGSQILLNVATVGGYGLAKDFTTINDANASNLDKAAASVGIILDVVPVLSAAKVANEGTKGALKGLKDSVVDAGTNLSVKSATSSATGVAFDQAKSNFKFAQQQLIAMSGQNLDVLASSADIPETIIKSAAKKLKESGLSDIVTNYEKAIVDRSLTKAVYDNAQGELREQVVKELVNVPVKTMTNGVKEGIKGFVTDHGISNIATRFTDLYKNSLKEAVKNSEPFFGKTVGDALGIKDIANFTISNLFNESMQQGITDSIKSNFATPPSPGKSSVVPMAPVVPLAPTLGRPAVVPITPVLPYTPAIVPSHPTLHESPPLGPVTTVSPYTPAVVPSHPTLHESPPVVPVTPVNPYAWQQYMGQKQQNSNPNIDPSAIDNTIQMIQANQQNFNNSRGVNNPGTGIVDNQQFSTGPGVDGGTRTIDHVQTLSTQTGGWVRPNTGGPCTTPCNPPVINTPPIVSTPPPCTTPCPPTPQVYTTPQVSPPCTTPCPPSNPRSHTIKSGGINTLFTNPRPSSNSGQPSSQPRGNNPPCTTPCKK